MPQMAPMWWTFIMIITISMMMLTMTFNYFNFIKVIEVKPASKSMKMNWMW